MFGGGRFFYLVVVLCFNVVLIDCVDVYRGSTFYLVDASDSSSTGPFSLNSCVEVKMYATSEMLRSLYEN